jgi:hypothetical protein
MFPMEWVFLDTGSQAEALMFRTVDCTTDPVLQFRRDLAVTRLLLSLVATLEGFNSTEGTREEFGGFTAAA